METAYKDVMYPLIGTLQERVPRARGLLLSHARSAPGRRSGDPHGLRRSMSKLRAKGFG